MIACHPYHTVNAKVVGDHVSSTTFRDALDTVCETAATRGPEAH